MGLEIQEMVFIVFSRYYPVEHGVTPTTFHPLLSYISCNL
jgi:hypothetical protein